MPRSLELTVQCPLKEPSKELEDGEEVTPFLVSSFSYLAWHMLKKFSFKSEVHQNDFSCLCYVSYCN
jgi:hypothetical protein